MPAHQPEESAVRRETRCIHLGGRDEVAVSPPIQLSTTFRRNADGTYPSEFIYTREKNPTRDALEKSLAILENGRAGLCFASGSAATLAIVHALKPGDHILAPADMYYGCKQIFSDLYARWGLGCTFIDMTNVQKVSSSVQANTKLLWLESPSNPMLGICDIERLAKLGRGMNITVLVDNTWSTPMATRPLDLGADVVLHSSTKYLGGHSDVLGGVLVFKDAGTELFERVLMYQKKGGGVPSPFDCWLIRRSLATLAVRFQKQAETANKVADFLDRQQAITHVLYPGLPAHPNHQIANSQMDNFGAMISIRVRGGQDAAMQLAGGLELFTRATSLGGVESLVEHRASVEGPTTNTPSDLLRLSIGLEHPDDLLADLRQALHNLA